MSITPERELQIDSYSLEGEPPKANPRDETKEKLRNPKKNLRIPGKAMDSKENLRIH